MFIVQPSIPSEFLNAMSSEQATAARIVRAASRAGEHGLQLKLCENRIVFDLPPRLFGTQHDTYISAFAEASRVAMQYRLRVSVLRIEGANAVPVASLSPNSPPVVMEMQP